jgi:hypothetical protein
MRSTPAEPAIVGWVVTQQLERRWEPSWVTTQPTGLSLSAFYDRGEKDLDAVRANEPSLIQGIFTRPLEMESVLAIRDLCVPEHHPHLVLDGSADVFAGY